MKAINSLKTSLIDKILTIQDIELLEALQTIVDSTSDDKVEFSETQKKMLQMSEEDIKYGRVVSQDDLDKEDLKWLSEQ